MMTDRALGTLLLACNSSFFIYYVIWIGVMPFVDESHFTQALFLPREYGLLLAALIMTTAIGVGMFVGSLHTIWRTGYVPPSSSRTLMGAETTTDKVAPDVAMAAR